ncbi:hypothetical protein EV193_105114 [Herbihabitans rhizosphaerae]|uniref:Dolichyl-phosphate-mannose-protein mannosyltransferase n=1 Tax=Herbihabitans rhizosphaerae TaxID=1872711 RepID=A0A4Q7KLL7_9PSEU|nr:hypothetical protein [Herbihabitans rhizosphaerae]RZS37558.1 hypothetical protein EV193_105114 [Herbihabitans rhizosphaerae]
MLTGVEPSRRRELILGGGVFAGSLVLLLLRFLVPRPVGYSDNGDGWRLLCQVGANELGGPSTDDFVRFLYQSGPDCSGVDYVASQVWFAKLGQWLGDLIGSDAALNLVLVGCVESAVAAAAVTAIVLGLRLSTRWRIVAAAVLLLVVADSAFFPFFASVATEGAAFLGITLTVGGLLLMGREGRWRYAGAVVTVFGGIVAANAKAQAVLILPLLVLALVFTRPNGVTGVRRWALPAVVAVIVSGVTGFLQLSYSSEAPGADTRVINAYHAVFHSIVDGQHDSAEDLAALGLPASYAKYQGTLYWGPVNATQDPEWPKYRHLFSGRNLAEYYATHPQRTGQILNRAASDLLTMRQERQGNFSANTGFAPRAKEFRVPVVSGVLNLVSPLGIYLLAPLWLAIGWVAVRAWRGHRREIGVVLLMLLGVAVAQFLVGGLAEGIENVKHQIIAAFATALAIALAGLAFVRVPRKDGCPDPSVGHPSGSVGQTHAHSS